MKLIHTSDWHLGHMLYSYDRSDEFLHFFKELDNIVLEEHPDALLVSGDIFDVSSPSAAVARMFKDQLLRIHEIVPEMTIIVTAGNHDSASKIDIDRNLWKAGGINVIGTVRRVDGMYDFSDNIVRVGDKGYVVAIPYVNSVFMPRIDDDTSPVRSFFSMASSAVEQLNTCGLPVVLMAHLTLESCDRRGHHDSYIGGVDAVSSDIFGPVFDYVALGHIHRRQSFEGGRIAYSGSPLAISFDEDYTHSVSIVNICKGTEPEIIYKEIIPLRELLTLPEDGTDFKKMLKLLVRFPDKDESYIRPYVVQKDELPSDSSELAISKAREKRCRLCPIKYEKITSERDESQITGITAAEFVETTPVDIARRYFKTIGLSDEEINVYSDMIAGLQDEISIEDSI